MAEHTLLAWGQPPYTEMSIRMSCIYTSVPSIQLLGDQQTSLPAGLAIYCLN